MTFPTWVWLTRTYRAIWRSPSPSWCRSDILSLYIVGKERPLSYIPSLMFYSNWTSAAEINVQRTWQFILNIHVNFKKCPQKEACKYSNVRSFSVNPRFQWGNRQTDLKEMKIARGLNRRQIVAGKCLLLRPFTYAFWLAIWYGSCQKYVKKLSKTFQCGNGRVRSTVTGWNHERFFCLLF